MRKVVCSFLLLLLTGVGYAQDDYPYTYTPAFQPGHYYTHTGERIAGLLRHNYSARFSDAPDNSFTFRKDKKSKKVTLGPSEAKAFVIGVDSFTIVKNFSINDLAHYREDFVKVVKGGKINLYLHATTGGVPGSMTHFEAFTFLVEKDGQLMRMKKSDFKDAMAPLVADYQALHAKIQAKELKYGQLEQIIEEYNNWCARKKS
jgi:hypothetical protein